ncbi:hypothetical protein [Oryza sativa Japonica Group]|uniref:Os01g0320400 protein n=3 Tax=Oryza TaxID=4527 RepID=A0A0P0V1T3_ORYSJ|nr:hypothetical protein OsJ_01520 [Oryza sativa Japonica Group]KAB8081197.1 hypothetical protein EE612_002185 [Oryza sativa]KAF2949882.1 hypothetical protein DAI22_01g149900 [Oryza sativa Japonica Group]BAD44968.1 hypothetical protein [Oryza sativa Japonica Group]BAD45211.1 hypothetical protein [Oryza sativa Japonica Group]|eukprot:NP_001172303.1 Os01g0320400 [Oryza sativa Japonica Group]
MPLISERHSKKDCCLPYCQKAAPCGRIHCPYLTTTAAAKPDGGTDHKRKAVIVSSAQPARAERTTTGESSKRKGQGGEALNVHGAIASSAGGDHARKRFRMWGLW